MFSKKIKTFILFIFISVNILQVSVSQEQAEAYKINSVSYISQNGNSKDFALERELKPDTEKIFNSKEELDFYILSLKQKLENLRLFSNINIDCEELSSPEENQVTFVDLKIYFYETKHILLLPKPGYNSNSGAELKLKLKDTNFLGLLEPLNSDINIKLGTEEEPDNFSKVTLGFNLDYDAPFNLFFTENTWSNDFSFSWQICEDKPEFSYETGLLTEIPLSRNFNLDFSFLQGIARDTDYEEFGDEFYFTENFKTLLPINLCYINNIAPLTYTPSLEFLSYWDTDKINLEDEDLSYSLLSFANSLETDLTQWKGNSREGFYALINESFGWNFLQNNAVLSASALVQYFLSIKRISPSFQVYAFYKINQKTNIGSFLRGTLDNQIYTSSSDCALKTTSALIFNIDVPVSVLKLKFKNSKLSIFNFELKISPFMDIALTKNLYTSTLFSLKDGFYDAGFEILVFPEKWKSFVLRLSVGFDLSRLLLGSYVNTNWRNSNVKAYEISFGLGLNY